MDKGAVFIPAPHHCYIFNKSMNTRSIRGEAVQYHFIVRGAQPPFPRKLISFGIVAYRVIFTMVSLIESFIKIGLEINE